MRLAAVFRSFHPIILWSSIVLFVLAAATLAAAGMDSRIIAGQNIWIKPFKFSVSIAIYLVTFGFCFVVATGTVRVALNFDELPD